MKTIGRLVLGAAAVLLFSACSDDGEGGTPPPAATATAKPTGTATSPPPSATPVRNRTPISSDLAAAANGGGCYPAPLVLTDPLQMLTLVNPEWVPVINGTTVDSEPVLVHGTVVLTHGDTGGDYPASHVRSDQNTDLRVDDADQGLLATGNGGVLALEWEAGSYPDWAWAGVGDRVVAAGRWIFDCGHPDPRAGHCAATTDQGCLVDSECPAPESCVDAHFGYSSEIHPPFAAATIRQGRGGIVESGGSHAVPATRADIFVSPYAGGAGDRCIVTHLADSGELLSVECYPLSDPIGLTHLNDRDFVFDLPLPARPAGAHASWRVIDRNATDTRPAALNVVAHEDDAAPHLEVHVGMAQASVTGALPTGYSGTIFAGWRGDSTVLTHVRVTVTGVVIRNGLHPVSPVVPKACSTSHAACDTSADCPSGQTCGGAGPVKRWRLQAAVNGEWLELSGLDAVDTGDVIPESKVFDQYLPANGQVQVLANGDGEDCIHTMLGQSLATGLARFGFAQGINCIMSTPHDAGEVNATYAAPDFGAGAGGTDYETVSTGGAGGSCSATTDRLCLTRNDCPNGETCSTTGGAFALRYRIEKITD